MPTALIAALAVLLSLGVLVGVPALLIAPWFVARSRFSELARAFGTSAAAGVCFQAAPSGVPTTITLEQPRGALRPRLVLTLRAPTGRPPTAEIIVRAETRLDRAGVALRLNRKIQLGAPEFDARMYLETDEPDAAPRALLADPRTRHAAEQAVDLGFTRLCLGGPTLVVATCFAPTRAQLSFDAVTRAAEACGVLAGAVTAETCAPVTSRSGLGAGLASIAFGIATFVAHVPAAVATHAFPLLSDTGSFVAAGLGVAAAAALAPLVALQVRGRPDSLRRFLWIALPMLWLVPWWSVAAVVTVNGALDFSAPVRVSRIVRDTTQSSGKTTFHRIEVDGLARGEPRLTVDVDPGLYASIERGDKVLVDVGPGALGLRWVRGVERGR
jgi:hypothetical protein